MFFGLGNINEKLYIKSKRISARIFSDKNFIAKEGLKKKFQTGTSFEISSTFNRLENTLNKTSASSLYSPEYESFTGLTLIQPILKGFGREANRAQIDIAQNRVEATQYLTEIKAINLIRSKSVFDLNPFVTMLIDVVCWFWRCNRLSSGRIFLINVLLSTTDT